MTPNHLEILNPNSSGQGYCDAHHTTREHSLLCFYGWGYSHTTVVTTMAGRKYALHTYKLGDWNIGLAIQLVSVFNISCSRGGSDRETRIPWYDLDTYLSSKTPRVMREIRKKVNDV